MSLSALLSDKLKRSRAAPAAFLSVVEKTQQKAMEQLIAQLSLLQTDANGAILINDANVSLINSITTQIEGLFFDREYQAALTEFVSSMRVQANQTMAIYELQLGTTPTATELYAQVLRASQTNAVAILGETGIGQMYMQPLKEQLLLSVTNGSTLQETFKAVRGITLGDAENEGILYRNAKTYGRTIFSQSDANYSSTIAKTMDVEWFKYSGDTIETTRRFCKTRHNKFYHVKEVEEWGTLKPWAGQIKGTNSSTIFTNRGGWNCRHQLIPYSVLKVPKDDIKRAINAGYYKPDETTKKKTKFVNNHGRKN